MSEKLRGKYCKTKGNWKNTCKAVEVLKMDTILAVQTKMYLPSFAKAGGETT